MNNAWHSLSLAEIEKLLKTNSETGLAPSEAQRRLARYGYNRLGVQDRTSPFHLLLSQFGDFMILVLVAATAISFFIGEAIDAVAIMSIVVLNALFGFVQEYRAERALAMLKKLAAPMARVVRNGKQLSVPAEELVPGDVLLLEIGSIVPADVRLCHATGLEADESHLTGESRPARKTAAVLMTKEIPLGDRRNMVYAGSKITRGRGAGVVVATGMSTEMGKIATMISSASREQTPLQVRLNALGKQLVGGCLVICGMVIILGFLRGEDAYNMFMAGVSLAVAAIPEGLPAVVTICLALGVQRMVRSNAIIRKLPAVETLGCATVICSDKTGTLTKNEMTVRSIYCDGAFYSVSGEGYAPQGQFTVDNGSTAIDVSAQPALMMLLRAALLCSNAKLTISERVDTAIRKARSAFGKTSLQEMFKGWRIVGDPTEGALVVAAAKAGLWPESVQKTYERIAEIPFEPERRMMSVICRNRSSEKSILFVKGAPDIIIGVCSFIYQNGQPRPLGPDDVAECLEVNRLFAGRSLRVLAVAYRELEKDEARYAEHAPEKLERNLVFLGLIGMVDPPRPESAEAIKICDDAGIKTVMVTGDHRDTAVAIAAEVGLLKGNGLVLTGEQLEQLDEAELYQVVDDVRVYARTSPQQKLKIVNALKRRGHVVAMTGDGVNDAPALKAAHIGVSMGISGTDVAKEVSEMVLADDNFASIVAAVREGRVIYDNVRKFIKYLLCCNVGEIVVMFMSVATGLPLPLVPIQLLWVNLVTDGLPALALGAEKGQPDVMKRAPRSPTNDGFLLGLGWAVASRGTLMGFACLGLFALTLWSRDMNLQLARSVAFTELVISQLLYAFRCRSWKQSIWDWGIRSNPMLFITVLISIILMITILYVPSLASLFKVTPLGLSDWIAVILVSMVASIGWLEFGDTQN